MYANTIKHMDPNTIKLWGNTCDLDFNGKGHGDISNALKSQHLAISWSQGVNFDMHPYITNHRNNI